MTELKLARLPDRTPIRIAISVPPELNRALAAYAELYREIYGEAESVTDLIPFMLESFLESDRSFARARRGKANDTDAIEPAIRASRRDGGASAESRTETRAEE